MSHQHHLLCRYTMSVTLIYTKHKLHLDDLLWICCTSCEFVVDVVDLLWTLCGCFILYKMASTDDTGDALLACTWRLQLLLCICTIVKKLRLKKRKHTVWISKYLCVRPQYGANKSLMRDLLELDTTKFRNYIRMYPDVFVQLLSKVNNNIERLKVQV